MEILWHGHSFFEIYTRPYRIVIDPFDERVGLKIPRIQADILLITHDHFDHNNKKAIMGDYFLIDGPGEYEIKGITIEGFESDHDPNGGKERGKNTIYVLEVEGFRIAHLGDLGQKELTEDQEEKLSNLDIVFVPVGGVYTIDGKEAGRIIQEIEPKIAVPMHYAIPNLKIKLHGVEEFLRVLGIKSPEKMDTLKLKKNEKLDEETRVILLTPL